MTNRDLANATRLARWIVANGYRPHMTRKMVLGLLRRDPNAPKPVPSAGSETVFSLSQWRCYLNPPPTPARPASISVPTPTPMWWMHERWGNGWSHGGTHQP